MIPCKQKSGFTLIEVLMVILLLGILSAVAVTELTSSVNETFFDNTHVEMIAIRNALVGDPDLLQASERYNFGYLGEVGSLPTAGQGLAALVTNPGVPGGGWAVDSPSRIGIGWNGPYLSTGSLAEDWDTDAWNNAYVYSPATNPPTVTSLGADGAVGGTGLNQDIVVQIPNNIHLSNVHGVIRDGGAVFSSAAEVVLNYPNGSGVITTSTDTLIAADNGSFSFTNIPMGVRSLTIYVPSLAAPTTTHGPVVFRVGSPEYLVSTDQTNVPAIGGGGACTGITVGFSSTTSQGDESLTPANFNVTLSAACASDISVNYSTGGGTAASGVDYTSTSGALTFVAGETLKTISVIVADDGVTEPHETFLVTLSGQTEDTTLNNSPHSYTISNDDGVCSSSTVQFTSATSSGAESTSPTSIDIELTATCGVDIDVDYSTSDNSAVAPGDYTSTSDTVTFTAGQSSKTISIPIIDDADTEAQEFFDITLSSPTQGSILGTDTHNRFITANDACSSTLSLDYSSSSGIETAGNALFAMTLSAACATDITIDYASSDISAVAGSDYTSTSGTLTITAGNTTGLITVPIINDADVESGESFKVVLSNPSPSSLSLGASSHFFSIIDDDSLSGIYYVRKSGNDGNSGTSPANAWLTIDQAAGTLTAGEIVFVGGGTYIEKVSANNDGTAANRITFIGDVSGTNTGDAGTVTIDPNQGSDKPFSSNGKDYITFKYFSLVNAVTTRGADIADSIGMIFSNNKIDNCDRGIDTRNSPGSYFENNEITNISEKGIRADGTGTLFILNNLISGGTNKEAVRLEENLVVDFRNNTIDGFKEGVVAQDSVVLTMRNNIITNASDLGISQEDSSSIDADYNLVWNNNTNYSGLTAGANDVNADPKFTNPGGADYTLDASAPSPALDAGSTTANSVILSDGSTLADYYSRSDKIKDGTSPDGTVVNMGFHYKPSN